MIFSEKNRPHSHNILYLSEQRDAKRTLKSFGRTPTFREREREKKVGVMPKV